MPAFFPYMGQCVRCQFPCVNCIFPLDTIFTSSVNASIGGLVTGVQAAISSSGSPLDITALVNRDTPSPQEKETMTLVDFFVGYLKDEHSVTDP